MLLLFIVINKFFVSSQCFVAVWAMCGYIMMMHMIKNILSCLFLITIISLSFCSCDDGVTYSEMKDRERGAVHQFIVEKNIEVITFDEFVANDSVTDVSRNQFVEIDDVYMQIVNNPKNAAGARKIEDGYTRNILVRYYEYNIQNGDTISTNLYSSEPDEMRVTNTNGTYEATFTSGVMPSIYGNAVPTGWLTPLNFLYFTRKTDNLAKVNIIVPHSKGTITAASYVYPCLYQISFQPENLYDFD